MRRVVTQRTYRFEQLRAVAAGVIETGGTTFLLLIAVRVFDAGPTVKALVAAGASFGLLFSPVTVALVARFRWRTSRAASSLAALGAVGFAMAALFPSLPVFTACAVLAPATFSALIPLLTQMYQENYEDRERGARFSQTVMIRVSTAALFGWVAGKALAQDLDGRYRWLLAAFAAAFAFSSFCLSRCPTRRLVRAQGGQPFGALGYVREDRLFRITLASWMLMGFANLMMLPLRVEYLANPRYGLTLPPDEIALMTVVIPGVVRLVLAPVWGRLFDRLNFFLLRVVLNFGFLVGILSFFLGETRPWLIAGAILFGMANAGGDVAWSLWVTKIAPSDRVAGYMSVHTFLTGVRSLVAPFAAFQLAACVSLPTLGLGSAGLIVAASALLLPEFKHGRAMRSRSRIGGAPEEP